MMTFFRLRNVVPTYLCAIDISDPTPTLWCFGSPRVFCIPIGESFDSHRSSILFHQLLGLALRLLCRKAFRKALFRCHTIVSREPIVTICTLIFVSASREMRSCKTCANTSVHKMLSTSRRFTTCDGPVTLTASTARSATTSIAISAPAAFRLLTFTGNAFCFQVALTTCRVILASCSEWNDSAQISSFAFDILILMCNARIRLARDQPSLFSQQTRR